MSAGHSNSDNAAPVLKRNRSARCRLAIELAIAVVIALAFLFYMRATAPVGRDISNSEIARTIVGEAATQNSASITLIIFADYRCPACRNANVALQSSLATPKNVDVVIREWPIFGPRSERLARYAIASDYQKLHVPFHDALMRAD
ncbi:MAG: hypothetical protein WA908_12705, partial [Pontixanthobacter sp.]